MNNIQPKKVSIPLAIGIFVIPLIFSWFTLQKGYSKTAKIISFGWLVLAILFSFLLNLGSDSVPPKHVATENVETIEPKKEQHAEKPKAVPQVVEPKEKSEQQESQIFTPPDVDYTKPVAKVSLDNDKAILKAAGKPVIEKEKSSDENGEPQTIYFFSSHIASGLEVALSRTEINVAWQFDRKDPKEATAIFEDGQRITRALLGGEGAELYEMIAKGQDVSQIQLRDGTIVKSARCGDFRCRYKILR